jgi:hypothetical protein
MTKTLTHEDIRTLLKNFAAAIDLDQRLVDAMPRAKFKPEYDNARGSMLRWLAVNDPLYIAQDPECGCGEPAGSVS